MGLFDTITGADGRQWQTKWHHVDGEQSYYSKCMMREFKIHDTVDVPDGAYEIISVDKIDGEYVHRYIHVEGGVIAGFTDDGVVEKKPWYYYPTMPIHLATRGWLKYSCMCCEGEDGHVGMSAIMNWFRDRGIARRYWLYRLRQKNIRSDKILCALGKHPAYVMADTEGNMYSFRGEVPCSGCRRMTSPRGRKWGRWCLGWLIK